MLSINIFAILFAVSSNAEFIRQPPTLSFSSSKLIPGRHGSAAVYDGDDSIYILGGSHYHTLFSDVLKYSVSNDSIENVGKLPLEVAYGTAMWDGTTAVHFGGWGVTGATDSIQRFNPEEGEGSLAGILPRPSYSTTSTTPNGYENYIFGNGNGYDAKIVKYVNGSAFEIPDQSLPHEHYGSSSAYCKNSAADSIFIFGGYQTDTMDTIIRYNFVTGESYVTSSVLPVPHWNSVAICDGDVAYVLGGSNWYGTTGVVSVDTKTGNVRQEIVDGFPNQLLRTTAVYVEKVKKAFIFSGNAQGVNNMEDILILSFN